MQPHRFRPGVRIDRALVVAILLASTLLLASCGGGGGGGGAADTQEITVLGLLDHDGTIRLESGTGLCEVDAFSTIRVGENEPVGTKFNTFFGFVTFDLSSLPAGATVRSASAQVLMQAAIGDRIFDGGFFGNVVMEHIDIGTGLDPSDMSSPSLSGQLVGGNATPIFLAIDSTLERKQVDITDEVNRDLADGRTKTSLRIRFQAIQFSDDDELSDEVEFAPFLPGVAASPFLVISFTN